MNIKYLAIWFSVGHVRLISKIKCDIREFDCFIVYLFSDYVTILVCVDPVQLVKRGLRTKL